VSIGLHGSRQTYVLTKVPDLTDAISKAGFHSVTVAYCHLLYTCRPTNNQTDRETDSGREREREREKYGSYRM